MKTYHFNSPRIVRVEISPIFIRGCNSLKLCLYFPENAPGTRNKISRKRDLWSPNMTHSDLNLLAWCCQPEHNSRESQTKHTESQSNSSAWLHYLGDNGEKWIEALSYCQCTRDVSIMGLCTGISASLPIIVPVVPLYLGNSAWQPGSQSLFTAYRLFICFDLSFSHSLDVQLATEEGRACLYQ